ncbi:MAG: glycerol-3-phosphate 1-O-acyltransferase PlsY [Rhodospirillaceae bacterium]|nr:glycerol-3-phosphate 1-O-acyltransferase PlsY [Rhodospirillaceae bacterium]
MPQVLGGFAYTWPYYAAALLGYFLGSVPFGLVLTRAAGLGDIRRMGSGNIGTTNVLRTGSKALAAATLLLDGGKGAAAVLIAARWGPDMAVFAGGGAILGHVFPVWLLFRGGKGVATTLGVLLALSWPTGLVAIGVWLLLAALLRYSSLAALGAVVAAPVYAWFLVDRQLGQFAALVAVVVWLRHYENIWRLIKGTEPRIGRRSAAPGPPG